MRVPIVLILGLLAVCAVHGSVVPDDALTASLQDAWYEDEFIIAISNIKEKGRRSASSIETLLAVKYRDARTKMVLLVDRGTKRVVLESLDESGRRSTSHVKVDSLAVNTPMKNLIILVHQAQPNPRVDVYVDCIYEGSIPLKKTFREIAEDNPFLEVFKERKCQAKVYQSLSIMVVLKKEQCPDNLTDMKQPSTFKPEHTKVQSTGSNKDDKKESTNRSDGTESDRPDGEVSSTPDQNGLTPSRSTKHPPNNKKPSKKNREKNKGHSGRPNGKPDKYDPYGSFEPVSQLGKSEETDDLDYPDLRPSSLMSQSTQSPKSNGSNETDGLDYPDGSRPPQFTSQSPYSHPTKRLKKSGLTKPDQSNLNFDKRPDGSGLYGSNKNPSLTPGTDDSDESGSLNSSKRPGRSPGQHGSIEYPDVSEYDTSGKRVPKRGDIGIQSLDERVCQTDDQLVKTLNELINATRKLWRELELNRMETEYLRQLIENCSACRTPIGE